MIPEDWAGVVALFESTRSLSMTSGSQTRDDLMLKVLFSTVCACACSRCCLRLCVRVRARALVYVCVCVCVRARACDYQSETIGFPELQPTLAEVLCLTRPVPLIPSLPISTLSHSIDPLTL